MDTEKQLLSEETAQNSECCGVQAPDLIQQDITLDEKATGQDHAQLKDKHIILSSREVSFIEGEKTQGDEIEVKAGPQKKKMQKEESPNDGKGKITDNDYTGNPINTNKSIALENVKEMNVLADSDIKKDSDQKDDSENKKTASKETIHETENRCITKLDQAANENKKSNEKPDSDVFQDDGNNNVGNVDVGQNNNGVRRTRFSSEIMIQPKAYFQAGTKTIVMMPPSCLSEDVFQNDSRNSADCFSSSSSTHVVVNAKPSDSVLPQTFLPLTLFTCLFCPMIGLFAVYKSYSVKESIKKGDIRKANEASQHARQLGVLTLCIGFLFVLAIVMIAVLVSTLT